MAAVLLVMSSFVQIGIWAAVLWRFGNFATVNDALVAPNRVLEPVEATNGMLAAGLNTAILFAILSNMARRHADYEDFFR